MAIITTATVVDKHGNDVLMHRQDIGVYPFKWEDGSVTEETLYHADPDCEHEAQRGQWSGISCRKCAGWFCH